ncbi:MAG TPA: preprotein translocase subunit SecE [Anaerolineales bacterium]|jgi:preprotein translocase subunit SecE
MAKTQASSRRSNPVSRTIRETVGELRKVSWPTRDEATRLTVMVLGVLLATSLLMGFLDYLFGRMFAYIITLG